MSDSVSLNASQEVRASSFNGYLMLLVTLALLAWSIMGFVAFSASDSGMQLSGAILGLFLALFVAIGFYMIQPNQGVALTLFGAYKGSDRNEGLRWVWPWMGKAKVSLRARSWSRVRSQWSKWRWLSLAKRELSNWMMSARRQWFPT
jgi:hypothetical protein